MEEEEFISKEDAIKKIENFSVEELVDYKKMLLKYLNHVESEINRKTNQRKEADKFFK